jgi:hypothetical protein
MSFETLCPVWNEVFEKWPTFTRVQKERAVTHLNFSEVSCIVAEAHKQLEWQKCKECLAFASWDYTFVIDRKMEVRVEFLQEINARFVKHFKEAHSSSKRKGKLKQNS